MTKAKETNSDRTKKAVFTKAMKDQMAGLLPMDQKSSIPFTPKQFDEIPLEFRPIYHIRQFNNGEIREIKTILAKDLERQIKFSQIEKGSFIKVDKKEFVSKEYIKKSECLKKLREESLIQSEKDNQKHKELALSIVVGWENLYDLATEKKIEYSETAKKSFTNNMAVEILSEGIKISGFITTR